MSSEEKTGSPPLYPNPAYAATPQPHQQYPKGPVPPAPGSAPPVTGGGTVPTEEVHHSDEKKELEKLVEIDPARDQEELLNNTSM